MLLAPCSAKLSAQSPPCSRKAPPLATRASARFRLRASPAKTSGGKVASCFSVSASAAGSGYSGTCRIGLLRQLSGVQRSAMVLSSVAPPHRAERRDRGGRDIGLVLPPSTLRGRAHRRAALFIQEPERQTPA